MSKKTQSPHIIDQSSVKKKQSPHIIDQSVEKNPRVLV